MIGTYAAYVRYDPTNLGLQRDFGVGGRTGVSLTRIFSLEASGDYSATRLTASAGSVNIARVGGTLLANTQLGLYLGAGYERVYYRGALDFEDNGPHVVLGERLPLGGRAALRIELRGAYFPTTKAPGATGKPLNLSGNVGLSVYSFGGPKRDSDKDGVADKKDKCAATPLQATVDADGCPHDTDTDAILDGLDACPGTPKGATVDQTGCPHDADADGVFDGIDVCPDTPAGASVDPNGCPIDTDGDKVFDGIDQCADTPAGAVVDATGCPLDTDGDKVFDGLDQCPDTPPNTEVDARGCAVITDADGDGVGDKLDQCPNTPAGTKVNETGCPADADNDGVENEFDRCPNTAAGTKVDAVGCPILFEVVEGKARALVLKGVTFQSGRSLLTPQSFAVLDEVAASLVANPQVRIEIGGHTDSVGVRARNVRLSQARAQAVRTYLASKGVAPNRMVAKGYGPDRPVAPNKTPAGRAANRRVELNLLQ
ncbi:MAG: OmpA family protein [Gemmatimonadetes bacterium]|nr:OmpA family protein [Gemmatimonadota bacterium]